MIDERDEEIEWNKYQERTFEKPPHDILLRALKCFDGFTGYSIDLGCGSGRDTMELLGKGWKVLAIDNNLYGFNKMKSKLKEEQLAKLETKEERFEEVQLPKADLVNASLSIPFCKPEYFDKFWATIVDAININGRFSGNFFGDRDDWRNNEKMTFVTKDKLLELFEDFQIEYLEEKEYDGTTIFKGNLKHKHWHIFNVVAKHIC